MYRWDLLSLVARKIIIWYYFRRLSPRQLLLTPYIKRWRIKFNFWYLRWGGGFKGNAVELSYFWYHSPFLTQPHVTSCPCGVLAGKYIFTKLTKKSLILKKKVFLWNLNMLATLLPIYSVTFSFIADCFTLSFFFKVSFFFKFRS